MALVRIEAVKDEASRLFRVEIYNPSDATTPFATTEPRYMTKAAAEQDMIDIIAAGASQPAQR